MFPQLKTKLPLKSYFYTKVDDCFALVANSAKSGSFEKELQLILKILANFCLVGKFLTIRYEHTLIPILFKY